jgi:TolA-binding protein
LPFYYKKKVFKYFNQFFLFYGLNISKLKNIYILSQMEQAKQPAVVVSLATLSGLVAVCLYGYRQMDAMRQDITTLDSSLSNVVNRILQLEKTNQASIEALRALHDQTRQLKQSLSDIPTMDDFADINYDLDELVLTLKDNKIPVDRPSQTPQVRYKSKRDNNRNANHYRGAHNYKQDNIRENIRSRRDDNLMDNDEDLVAAGNLLGFQHQ